MDILLEQINSIIDPKVPLISNLSNVSSLLNNLEDINWCGFYLVNENALYLGPFQGEVACTIIPFSKGVCGTCYTKKETVIVDNVLLFPGHIACSNKSRSEIVTPIIKNNKVVGLIDIDSPSFNRFSEKEAKFLEAVASKLSELDYE